MYNGGVTTAAVLFQFDTAGGVTLVFHRRVITFLALSAGHSNDLVFLFGTHG